MQKNLPATKGNLMLVKKSLSLAKSGYDLMDRKRNVLIREVMNELSLAKEVKAKIGEYFSSAYSALQSANLTLGINNVVEFSKAVEEETHVSIKFRSVMGVEVPIVELEEKDPPLYYDLAATNSALDMAYIAFEKVKYFSAKLAQIETGIYRLATAIKKTQVRANALKNITIPSYELLIHNISADLEEREREEFTRLKKI